MRGQLRGTQLAFGANVAAAETTGLQGAGFVNVGRLVEGAQLSFGVNMAGVVEGNQTAALNTARRVEGAQLGGVQVARTLDGVQIGLVNVGGSVRGAQIGVVNIGGSVRGAQIGLVNLGGRVGAPIGLLSFTRSGYNHLWALGSDAVPYAIGVTSGGERLYSLFELGRPPGANASTAVGLGWHPLVRPPLVLDADLAAVAVDYVSDDSVIVRARVLVGAELAPHLAIVLGPSLSVAALGQRDPTWMPSTTVGGLPTWIGATAGLRF